MTLLAAKYWGLVLGAIGLMEVLIVAAIVLVVVLALYFLRRL
jgi:hypothetical protein